VVGQFMLAGLAGRNKCESDAPLDHIVEELQQHRIKRAEDFEG